MSEPKEKPAPNHLARGLVLVILFIAIAIGGYQWWWNRSHVTTDNAQVEGHIIPVLSKVGGFIAEVNFEDHQIVTEGDLLARIDDREYRVRLAQAEAELELAIANAGHEGLSGRASAELAAARSAAAATHSMVEQTLANADRAQKELTRLRNLVEKNMVSQQKLDDAEATTRAALAQLRSTRESAQSADEQIAANDAALRAAQAKVNAARAARDLAAQELVDTRILAPATGVASNKAIEPGQLVRAGQPIVALVPLDDIWVIANLKETEMQGVLPGAEAEVEVDSYPDMKLPSLVASISPATGARFTLLPPDNATGNFTKVVQRIPVKLKLKQNDDHDALLRPGMSVQVTITKLKPVDKNKQ